MEGKRETVALAKRRLFICIQLCISALMFCSNTISLNTPGYSSFHLAASTLFMLQYLRNLGESNCNLYSQSLPNNGNCASSLPTMTNLPDHCVILLLQFHLLLTMQFHYTGIT